MTTPVGFGSSQPAKMPEIREEEHKQKAEGAVEVEASNPSLEKEFCYLIERYVTTIRITSGCGARAQEYIDSSYEDLIRFSEKYPEFKSKLPEKYQAYDDRRRHAELAARIDSDDYCVIQ